MPHFPKSVARPLIVREVEHVLGPARQGKVRAMWDIGSTHLFVLATNRLSAFDYLLGEEIPSKGTVLNCLTVHWIDVLGDSNHHLVAAGVEIDQYLDERLHGRPVLQTAGQVVVKKKPAKIECVIRGYLTGSGYKDYVATGKVCGIDLPKGLRDGDRLPEPVFTPSTKADEGHDVNITEAEAADIVGWDTVRLLKARALELYGKGATLAEAKGFIVADTKFEFGEDGTLIDEILTPDSSRFWTEKARLEALAKGKTPPSHDKQIVRDYLAQMGFKEMTEAQRDAFRLPMSIKEMTSQTYLTTFERLAGRTLEAFKAERLRVLAA